jgi:serine/threonine-protein kinase HipA
MSEPCLVCLEDAPLGDSYHAKCLHRLFGVRRAPVVDVELAKLYTLAQAMVGHTSLSGVQRKISVGLTADRATLQIAIEGGAFILKPQAQTFPCLPENEQVTMRIAALAGIETPPCGLVRLRDGSLAYLIRRFDRDPPNGKLLQEDFCQLGELSPKQKYEGSAELCARLVKRFASEPVVEAAKLFRRMVFTWWTGNGDMHLKNFSLLRTSDGLYRLSPAYDLLCTSLVVEDEQLALSVGGNKRRVTPRQWFDFAAYCRLTEKAAIRVFSELAKLLEPAVRLVERSRLPAELQERYVALLRDRSATLERAAQGHRRSRS